MLNQYYTYIYSDPKKDLPIYVGKGCGGRAYMHNNAKCRNGRFTRLSSLIQKRIAEGYIVDPVITYHATERTAHAMEIFWIAVYGCEDLGKGSLFNRTDGGEGSSGMKLGPMSAAHKTKIAESIKAKPFRKRHPQTEETKKNISDAKINRNKLKTYLRYRCSRLKTQASTLNPSL